MAKAIFGGEVFRRAEQFAQEVEKQIPRGLKPARNDKKRLNGTTKVVP
jgi:hypothetical protein